MGRLAWVCLFLATAALATPADDLLAQARAYATEQSWHLAVRDYGAFIERYPADPRAAEAGLARIRALLALRGEAWLATADADAARYLARWRGTVWELRARRVVIGRPAPGEPEDGRERRLALLARCRELLPGGGQPVRAELAEVLMMCASTSDPSSQARARLLEAAALDLDVATRARIWAKLAQWSSHAARRDPSQSYRQAEALGWWLRIVREAPDSAQAAEAWCELGAAAADPMTARARYREALARRPEPTLAQRARYALSSIEAPSLYASLSGGRVGQPLALSLSGHGVPAVWLTLRRVATADVMAGDGAMAETEAMLRSPRTVTLASWRVDAPDKRPYRSWTVERTLPYSAAGCYVLSAKPLGATVPDLRWEGDRHISSDLAVQEAWDGRDVTVLVIDRTTLAPVPGAAVTLATEGEKEPLRWYRGTTGADGVWRQAVATPTERVHVDIWARRGDELVKAGDCWEPDSAYFEPGEEKQLVGFVTTERSVYRPGQPVHLAAMLRHFGPPPRIAAGEQVTVTISNPRDEQVHKVSLTTDSAGLAHTDWQVPADAQLGEYSAVAAIGDEVVDGRFSVEEYRLPELRASVEPPAGNITPGESTMVTVRAALPSGLPVGGVRVDYEISSDRYWPRLDASSAVAPWLGELPVEECDWRGAGEDRWPVEPPRRGSTVTDANGVARVAVSTAKDGRDRFYNLSATLTDASGRPQTVRGGFASTSRDAYLWAATDRVVYRPGQQARLALTAQDPDGRRIPARLRIELYRLRLERGDEKSRDWRCYAHFEREALVWARNHDLPTPTDSVLATEVGEPGCYQLVARTSDGQATATASYYVAADSDHAYPLRGLHLVPDRARYRAGDTAHLLVLAPVRGLNLVIGRRRPTGTEPFAIQAMPGNLAWLEVPLDQGVDEAITIRAIGPAGLLQTTARLRLQAAEPKVRVSVDSDAATYPVRGAGRLKVRTTSGGQPVSTRVLVAVTNQQTQAGGRRGQALVPDWFADRSDLSGPPRHDSESSESEDDRPGLIGVERTVIAHRLVRPGQEGDQCMSSAAAPIVGMDFLRGGMDGPHYAQPAIVREDFPDTLLWAPDITTDANGEAELPMRLADNLTTWQASALAVSGVFDIGVDTTTFTATKDLLVRLIAPAALTQGDEATIAAVPAWAGARPVEARVTLAADAGRWLDAHESVDTLARGGDTRLRSRLRVDQQGQVTLTATAAGETQADAMRLRVPVWAHGVEQFDRRAAVAAAGRPAQADLALPPCQTGTQRLRLKVTASRSGTLLDAATWVAREGEDDEEPDTWQAASRALIGNIALRVARWAGPAPESPEPPQTPRRRRGGGVMGRAVSGASLDVSAAEDGGYGWRPEWPSDPEVSAFTGEALTTLLDLGRIDGDGSPWRLEPLVRQDTLGGKPGSPPGAPPPLGAEPGPSRGPLTAYLERYLRRAGDASETTAQAAWVVDQVLARHLYRPDPAEDVIVRAAADRLWAGRARLGDEGLARLAMVLKRRGDSRSATAWRNLVARLVTGPDTASWGYDRDPVSATALGLQAALVLEPRSDLADKAANWLFLNRSGSRWHNAVATARAIAALADWSETRREAAEPARLTLTVDGRPTKTWDVAKEQVLRFAEEVTLTDLAPGTHRVTLTRDGQGSAYLGADLTWLSAEEPIRATGHRLTVARAFGLVGDQGITPLAAGQAVPAGALVEVELKLRAEVPLDWVTVTVPTPAGCRAVEAGSGYCADGLWCYRQIRERGVDLSVDHLPQGTSTLRYRLRAEAPGRYHALPPQAQALLLPSVSAVGDEQVLVISGEGGELPPANAPSGEPTP